MYKLICMIRPDCFFLNIKLSQSINYTPSYLFFYFFLQALDDLNEMAGMKKPPPIQEAAFIQNIRNNQLFR